MRKEARTGETSASGNTVFPGIYGSVSPTPPNSSLEVRHLKLRGDPVSVGSTGLLRVCLNPPEDIRDKDSDREKAANVLGFGKMNFFYCHLEHPN